MFCFSQGKSGTKLWKPGTWSVVCSRHFKKDNFKTDLKRKRLLPDAVPSVFEDYPPHKQKNLCSRREIKKYEKPISKSTTSTPEYDIPTTSSKINFTEHNSSMSADFAPSNIEIRSTNSRSVNTRITMRKLNNQNKELRALKEKLKRAKKNLTKYKNKIKELDKINKDLKLKFSQLHIDSVEECVGKTPKAGFLIEQLTAFGEKKHRWKDETIRYAILLHSKSPSAYNFIRTKGILSLPSKSTLKRYVGFTT